MGETAPELGCQPTHGLADDLEVIKDPYLDQLLSIQGFPVGDLLLRDPVDRLEHVEQPLARVSQRGSASCSTRSRMRPRSPLSVTTSTRRPSSSSRSTTSPPRSIRLRPLAISTRKSTSLCRSASPRATEPKTRTLLAP